LPSGVTTFLFPSDLAIKIRCHELGQDRHGESSWIWVETSHAFRCFFLEEWSSGIIWLCNHLCGIKTHSSSYKHDFILDNVLLLSLLPAGILTHNDENIIYSTVIFYI
jgi:hypothetical protein